MNRKELDELMMRVMDGHDSPTSKQAEELATLRSDLRALRDQVPAPSFSAERLRAAIEAAPAKGRNLSLRWSLTLAPMVACALGIVILTRLDVANAPLTPPVAASAPVAQFDAELPPTSIEESPMSAQSVSGKNHTPMPTGGSVWRHRRTSSPSQTLAARTVNHSMGNGTGSKPSEGAQPMALTHSTPTAPPPSEAAVIIDQAPASDGVAVAREVESVDYVVVGG